MLLSEIEKSDALIILATNLPECLDEAMYRRITLSLEFPVPDFCDVGADLAQARPAQAACGGGRRLGRPGNGL